MANWVQRQFSKTRIDRAGERLIAESSVSVEHRQEAYQIVNNWRASHAFPLNTFQIATRRLARQLDPEALIAQRIKRLSSIELKLRRFPTMTLSQMQDLGGCRAIVRDVATVRRLAAAFTGSKMKHKLHVKDDYVATPQTSGYRGIHLIYKYFSDRSEVYNNQKIEVQLRSFDQHAWATAVETVGTFTRHALKSSMGPDDWLRFFALMGSAIAAFEQTAAVPDTPDDPPKLSAELRQIARELDVVNRLRSYGEALREMEDAASLKHARYFLIELELQAGRTMITGFRSTELEAANAKYLEVEERLLKDESGDAVLVSVENATQLRRAYPNYFLDTHHFLGMVQGVLQWAPTKRPRKKRSRRVPETKP